MSRQSDHEAFTLEYYRDIPHDMTALRAALCSATHMCDAVAADIIAEGGRGAKMKVAAIKRAGDAIWALRQKLLITEQGKAP